MAAGQRSSLASKRSTNWSASLDMDEMATSMVNTSSRVHLQRDSFQCPGRN